MKTIKVKLTKEQNANDAGVSVGSIVEVPLSDYLISVTRIEMGAGRTIEAYKAQAVASRTYAYPYYSKNKAISDRASDAQSYSYYKFQGNAMKLIEEAVEETDGELLHYNRKIIDTCVYSASNGGRTTSSKERWGGERAYLIEQDDPWDIGLGFTDKKGHGVGMSQRGAAFAAKRGISYRDILSFYYPGTTIGKEVDDIKEESPMAKVKASDLVSKFKIMLDEKWKYVAGGAKYGEVDCSGAFTYWYKQLGSTMYHGSNTMWRKWSTEKGKIGEIELVPGMAVYKVRDWTSAHASNGWYNTDPGDVYHVGLYIGNDEVIEAKGTKYGVVKSKLSAWHLASKLKDTQYDAEEKVQEEPIEQNIVFDFPRVGIADISGSYMNIRSGPGTSYPVVSKLYRGDTVTIIAQKGDWYQLDKEEKAYVSKNCISLIETINKYSFEFVVTGDEETVKITNLLNANGVKPNVTRM